MTGNQRWTAAGRERLRNNRESAEQQLEQAQVEQRERERQREAAAQRRLISEVME
jgi:hypothetical protein